MTAPRFVLTASCPDRKGIVAAVSTFLADRDCFIVDSAHHGDPVAQRFFMRSVFEPPAALSDRAALGDEFAHVARRFEMQWAFHDAGRKARVMLLVSKAGHCLNDLLYRCRAGILPIELPAIVGNHADLEEEVRWHGIPFHHLPVDEATRREQEAQIWRIVQEQRIDLVVLARYMQVLSADLCEKLHGRCINIHHSFLPGFKGARPYHQAYERGVKIIGATAHYVTSDLDEGPIIEQAVERVDHGDTPAELAAVGRDIESGVLARAVRYHVEHRVLLNGRRTVVFR